MGWTTKVEFLAGAMMKFFLFTTASRPALESTHPPIQCVPGALYPWGKVPGAWS